MPGLSVKRANATGAANSDVEKMTGITPVALTCHVVGVNRTHEGKKRVSLGGGDLPIHIAHHSKPIPANNTSAHTLKGKYDCRAKDPALYLLA